VSGQLRLKPDATAASTDPPRLARWLLDRALPRDVRGDTIRGDLLEEFRAGAGWPARGRYWRNVLSVSLRYGFRRRSEAQREKPTMVVETVWSDVKYAIRSYAKTPSFTLAVVATLALGIGASTAIFSMVNGIVLRALPLRDPDRLVYINEVAPNGNLMSVAWPTYLDWTTRVQSVESIADSRDEPLTLTGVDRAQRIRARRATASFFTVVGVAPAMGRAFSANADRPNAAGEVILSDAFWRRQLAADPAAVERTMLLDGVAYAIVGVLPPDFTYIRPYDVFVSMGPVSGTQQLLDRGNHTGFSVVARLKPGIAVETIDRELKTIATALQREYPKTNSGVSAYAEPLAARIVSDIRLTMLALLGAVGFLLLIACVNVANLLIARGAARQHELAVRAALGGGRGRLTAQLLVESTLVSGVGGLLGVGVAFWLLRALVAVAPDGTPRIETVSIDGAALAFALGAAVLCGMVFGLFPAFQASGVEGQQALVRTRAAGASARSHRLRRALMVLETALAIVLLTGAGLTMRTLQAITRLDSGFQTDHLLTLRVMLAGEQWTEPRRLNFFGDLATKLRAVPGVAKAALAYSLPIDGSQWNSVFVAADKTVAVRAETPAAAFSPVGTGYFETLGMRVARGRVFDDRDGPAAPLAVVVNETLARRIWPGEDPVGKHLKQGWSDSPTRWREVIGVVGDVKFEGLTADTPMQIYVPMTQNPVRMVAALVRTASRPALIAPALESVVHDLDKDLPVYALRTMDDMLDTSIARQRMSMLVFAVFAGVALVLASIGLYGVVAHGVTERTHEIGVRMALGADRRHVLSLVVRQGLAMAAVGTLIGVVAALGLSRLIESLLFHVKPTDPVTFVAVVATLLAVAALACYVPAWRATRVDPTQALRAE
jgi:putative ABC transport system permease protein